MTREEAIHVIQSNRPTSGYTMLCEALDMAVAALQEQDERRWIPVTERLPDKPMKCLVYTKRGYCGGYDISYYNQGFYLQYANVTHWIPLPEPPKGE